jgi:hypothetical protein
VTRAELQAWLDRPPPLKEPDDMTGEPIHVGLPLLELERLLCRELGHRWVEHRNGAPVTEFELCARCGKIGERLPARDEQMEAGHA